MLAVISEKEATGIEIDDSLNKVLANKHTHTWVK